MGVPKTIDQIYTYDMEKNMKKLGRPPKSPADKASATITIKLTQSELDELQAAIGPGLRTWARELMLKTARRNRSK